jgi:hypothetical protein
VACTDTVIASELVLFIESFFPYHAQATLVTFAALQNGPHEEIYLEEERKIELRVYAASPPSSSSPMAVKTFCRVLIWVSYYLEKNPISTNTNAWSNASDSRK